MSNSVFRIQVERLQSEGATAFIGKKGELFYDPADGILRLSNGSTAGGVAVAGGSGGGGGGSTFDPTLYYTTTQIDNRFTSLLGTATAQGDTLGELQQNFINYLPLSGGTLTGTLVLAGAPTNANDAATKAYVDSRVSTTTAGYLPTAGGTLTGALFLPLAAPTLANEAANKSYVDSQISTAVSTAVTTVSIDADIDTQTSTGPTTFNLLPTGKKRSFNLTAGGNAIITLNGTGVSTVECGITVRIKPTGAYTVTWPASVKWAGGVAPSDPTANKTSMYVLSTIDNGVTWFGNFAGEFA